MKTFRERITHLLREFFSLAKRSGGLIVYSLVMYVLFVISYETRNTEGALTAYSSETLVAYSAPFLILVYVLLYRFRSKGDKKFRIIVGLIPAVLLALWGTRGIESFMTPTVIATSLVLSLMLLIVTYPTCGAGDKKLVMKTYDIFLSISATLFLGFTLMLLLWGVIQSISFLFDIYVLDDHKMYIEVFIPFVVMPLIYRMLESRFAVNDDEDSIIFNVTFNYLLAYAALIYTVIILLYLIKCFMTFTVPNGVFATISVVMYFLGLLVYVSQHLPHKSTRFVTWLTRQYKWAIVPTLMLYAWAVGVRVDAYGLTEPRVYLIAFGLIMFVTAVSLFVSPTRVYRMTLFSCFVVMGGLSYNFVVTPHRLAYWSQEYRMSALAKELGYLDESGKLLSVNEINAKGDGTDTRIGAFKTAYNFVTLHPEEAKKIYAKYGEIDERDIVYDEYAHVTIDPTAERSLWLYAKREDWQIDATSYSNIYLNLRTMLTEKGEVELYLKDSLLTTCPMDTIISQIRATCDLEEISESAPIQERIMVRYGNFDLFFGYLDLRYKVDKGWSISSVRAELVGELKESRFTP